MKEICVHKNDGRGVCSKCFMIIYDMDNFCTYPRTDKEVDCPGKKIVCDTPGYCTHRFTRGFNSYGCGKQGIILRWKN